MKLMCIALMALAAFPSVVSARKPASFDVALPGSPFGVAASRDGQWIFVSFTLASLSDRGGGQRPGLAVLRNNAGNITVERTVPMSRPPLGLVLTHDGKMLIAAAGGGAVFFDTQRLETGQGDPDLQWISDGPGPGSIDAAVTSDDKTLLTPYLKSKR